MSHFTLKIQCFKVLGFALVSPLTSVMSQRCIFLTVVLRDCDCKFLCPLQWDHLFLTLSSQEDTWALGEKYMRQQLLTWEGRMSLHRKTKVALLSKLFLDSFSKYKLEVMNERSRVQIYLCVSCYWISTSVNFRGQKLYTN